MKTIWITATTPQELGPLEMQLIQTFPAHQEGGWWHHHWHIIPVMTGPGMPMVLLNLAQMEARYPPDRVLSIGIAGAMVPQRHIGEVVEVVRDVYADLGAEDSDGRFLNMGDLGLWHPDAFPFRQGWLENPIPASIPGVVGVSGISVNTIPGTPLSIQRMQDRYDFEVETMENAAFFHFCLARKIPFVSFRGVSNAIEPRNRERWNIPGAVDAVSQVAFGCLSDWVAGRGDEE